MPTAKRLIAVDYGASVQTLTKREWIAVRALDVAWKLFPQPPSMDELIAQAFEIADTVMTEGRK